MPIIRRQLKPADVYPEDIRYDMDTDTVQSFVNGAWVDNPDADPRNQTTFPPRLTSDSACDAAQSVSDAFKAKIAPILEAIDNSATVFSIAGLILSIFTFGVFAIFVGLALGIGNVMLDAGTTAISAALTDAAFDTLTCIIRCNMDASGRLNPGAMTTIQSDVSAQIGGLGATLLNAMLSLAGEGGVNNLASIGTSTGDCVDCGCNLCEFDNWDQYYLGTLVERGDNYAIFDSVNVPGVHGNHRVAFGTDSDDECCYVANWEFIDATPADAWNKYILCGHPVSPSPEDDYTHGIPTPSTSVWVVACDAAEPFTIKFTFV